MRLHIELLWIAGQMDWLVLVRSKYGLVPASLPSTLLTYVLESYSFLCTRSVRWDVEMVHKSHTAVVDF